MSENGIKERAHNNLPHIHFPCSSILPRPDDEEKKEKRTKKKKDDHQLLEEEVNAFFSGLYFDLAGGNCEVAGRNGGGDLLRFVLPPVHSGVK